MGKSGWKLIFRGVDSLEGVGGGRRTKSITLIGERGEGAKKESMQIGGLRWKSR